MNSGICVRVVGEVGIHRHHHVVPSVEHPGESLAICASETGLAGPVQHGHSPDLGSDRFGDRAGSVGAVVVDHEHIGRRRSVTYRSEEQLDVLGLVVRREHHHAAHVGRQATCHGTRPRGAPGSRRGRSDPRSSFRSRAGGARQAVPQVVIRQHPDHGRPQLRGRRQDAGDPVDHAAAMAPDVGGTAGVAHPAASVRLSPHPSASDALATIHAS